MTHPSIQDSILQLVNEGMAQTLGSFTHTGDYKIDGNVTVNNLSIDSMLTVGTIRANRIVTLEGSGLELGTFTGTSEADIDGRGLRFVAPGVETMLVYRDGQRLWSNSNFDLATDHSYHIDNTQVLSLNSIGPTVTQSSLRQVGTLNKLRVSGDTVIGDFAHFSSDSGRLGVNTESPNAALSVVENNIELVIGSESVHRAKIGTYTNDHLDIVTDDTTRISISNNGEVSIGHPEYNNGVLRVHGKLYADEVISDTRLSRTTSLIFEDNINDRFYGKGIEWVGKDRSRSLSFTEGPDRIVSSEHFDLADGRGYFIENQLVLSKHALGPAVAESNLVKVGILQDLTVSGKAQFTSVTANSISVNNLIISETGLSSSGAFTIRHGDNDEFIIDSSSINIGHRQNTNRSVRIFGRVGINVANSDPSVGLAVAGNLSFANKQFSTGTQNPTTGTYNKGDVCWNSNPNVGGYIGWVCIAEGTPGQWHPFGLIA